MVRNGSRDKYSQHIVWHFGGGGSEGFGGVLIIGHHLVGMVVVVVGTSTAGVQLVVGVTSADGRLGDHGVVRHAFLLVVRSVVAVLSVEIGQDFVFRRSGEVCRGLGGGRQLGFRGGRGNGTIEGRIGRRLVAIGIERSGVWGGGGHTGAVLGCARRWHLLLFTSPFVRRGRPFALMSHTLLLGRVRVLICRAGRPFLNQ